MIDTIKIRLPFKKVSDEISERFHPIALNELLHSSKTHLTTRFNPGKSLAKCTEYTPTYIGEKFIINGTPFYYLAVEASLPKLLSGNNVEELSADPDDFGCSIEEIMRRTMLDLGLMYEREEIINSEVAKLHVGKNFVFDDPGAPLFIIDTIYKSRADRLCDDNQTKYENLGYSFRLHTNNKEVIFYDKKKDIEQSKKSLKRAIDGSITNGVNDSSTLIGNLLSNSMLGVLRMEVRLNNKTQIKKAFPSIGDDLTFRSIMLEAPIIPYLESEWKKATNSISAVQLSKENVSAIFGTLASKREYDYSLTNSLAVAAAVAIINQHGLDYLRSQVEKYYSKDAWYRFRKAIFMPRCCQPSYFKKVELEIQDYRPIDLSKYYDDLIKL